MSLISFIIGIVAMLGSITLIAGLLPGNLFIIFVLLSIIGLLLALMDKTSQRLRVFGLLINLSSVILLFLAGISLLTI